MSNQIQHIIYYPNGSIFTKELRINQKRTGIVEVYDTLGFRIYRIYYEQDICYKIFVQIDSSTTFETKWYITGEIGYILGPVFNTNNNRVNGGLKCDIVKYGIVKCDVVTSDCYWHKNGNLKRVTMRDKDVSFYPNGRVRHIAYNNIFTRYYGVWRYISYGNTSGLRKISMHYYGQITKIEFKQKNGRRMILRWRY